PAPRPPRRSAAPASASRPTGSSSSSRPTRAGRAPLSSRGVTTDAPPWTPAELEARLRAVGAARYHDKHPFNVRMHEGRLSREEIQTWVRNRYYYQTRIPVKDSAILAKADDPAFRREWVQRLHDHDGRAPGEGGLELWLRLAETVGLARDEVARMRAVLHGVPRASDAYVELVES